MSHLHFSRGLQPDARYFTRSDFVSCCVVSGATVLGAALIFVMERGAVILSVWLGPVCSPILKCRGGRYPRLIIELVNHYFVSDAAVRSSKEINSTTRHSACLKGGRGLHSDNVMKADVIDCF